MSGVNRVILLGNLGRDPEQRTMPNGNAVTNFSIATSRKWKDKNTGQQVEKSEWHRIACFNRLAEIAGQYLRKGSKVYIEGELRTRQWEKDGQTHYTTEIVANELQMLDAKGSGQQQPQQQASGGDFTPPPAGGGFDDDVPFAAYDAGSIA